MSDAPVGADWWQASDGKWYPPQARPPGPGARPPGPIEPQNVGIGQWMPYGKPLPATNQKATAALVMACLALPFSLFCGIFGLTFQILPLIFGILARQEIKRTGQDGAGAALTAIVLSGGGLVFGALLLVIVFSGAFFTG